MGSEVTGSGDGIMGLEAQLWGLGMGLWGKKHIYGVWEWDHEKGSAITGSGDEVTGRGAPLWGLDLGCRDWEQRMTPKPASALPPPPAPSCSSKHPPESCATDPISVPITAPRRPPSNATCSALGVGHVRTFDLLHHDFSGSCLHLLAEQCSRTKNNRFFRVLIRAGSGGVVGVVVQVFRTVVEMENERVMVSNDGGE